ncbi:hypothetical protein [Streptomyces sp. TLI_171]|uniref:hypothetical protein n=1 Tax=Streptomyces sp. TLI_171 TaxID=1938859 RepID=UPI000C19AF6C|nr:hypothetical protein [Streptomyces sp. TLI_171]RKE05099.1 hypothetical protein BX266_7355 [Streptomyces sp. TLI_171]
MTAPNQHPQPTPPDGPESTVIHEQQSDHELHDAFDLTARGFSPHSPDLVHRAAVRGQRLRRIRQAQLAAAAVLVVGTSGLGLTWLGPAAAPGPLPPAATSTAPGPLPSSTAPVTPTDSAQLLDLLRGKLPSGLQLSAPFRVDPGGQWPSGEPSKVLAAGFALTKGSGRGAVGITFSRTSLLSTTNCTEPSCTATRQPDGTTLMVRQLADASGLQTRSAVLEWPDGSEVMVVASNDPGEEGKDGTRHYSNAPLLGLPEVSALVLDPAWRQVMAGLPAQ